MMQPNMPSVGQQVNIQFNVEAKGEIVVLTFSCGANLYQQMLPPPAARELVRRIVGICDALEKRNILLTDSKGRPSA